VSVAGSAYNGGFKNLDRSGTTYTSTDLLRKVFLAREGWFDEDESRVGGGNKATGRSTNVFASVHGTTVN